MKKLIISLFVFLFISSCYEDKGNYDYKDIQKIDIDFGTYPMNVALGDTVKIEPKLSVSDIDETSKNHIFKWYLNGKTRDDWNKKIFEWKVDKVLSDADLVLKIYDKRYDITYMNKLTFSVAGIYETNYSWMILSEKDGDSKLSFLSVAKMMDSNDEDYPKECNQLWYKKVNLIQDVYKNANDGASLGQNPIALQEHWIDDYDNNGNVLVFQGSGTIDVNGTNFEKEISLNEAFDGGTYPSNVTALYPGTFMGYVDVVSDQDGKLYSRIKKSDKVFNSEYFLQTPLKVYGEDEVLEKCRVVRGYYASNRIGKNVIYDGKNKRLLYIDEASTQYSSDWTDEAMAGGSKIHSIEVKSDLDLKNTVPLNDLSGYDLLHMSQYGVDGSDYGYFMVLKNEISNKLYLQRFESHAAWGKPRYVIKINIKEIEGLPSIDGIKWKQIACPIYGPQEYVFIAFGSKLYYVDLLAEGDTYKAHEYYKFESDIVALNYDSYKNYILGVGLNDGTFCVVGVNQAKLTKDEFKILYKSKEKLGKIVDVKYKQNGCWNY